MKPKKKNNRAPWCAAFPDQRKKLHPDRQLTGGIKSRSTPEKIRMEIYLAIKKLWLTKHNKCEACPKIGIINRMICGGPIDCHHSRGKLGWLLVDVRWWIPVCRTAHTWIDANKDQAAKLGLLCEKGKWNAS